MLNPDSKMMKDVQKATNVLACFYEAVNSQMKESGQGTGSMKLIGQDSDAGFVEINIRNITGDELDELHKDAKESDGTVILHEEEVRLPKKKSFQADGDKSFMS